MITATESGPGVASVRALREMMIREAMIREAMIEASEGPLRLMILALRNPPPIDKGKDEPVAVR